MSRKLLPDENLCYTGLIGLAVADAVGVPYEFKSRQMMDDEPAVDMVGYGTHNQPEGTWSDDTTMALCLAKSLENGFSPDEMMRLYASWLTNAEFTATDTVFDIGRTCRTGIYRFLTGTPPVKCGSRGATANGNGSIMRTFPVSLWAIAMQKKAKLTDKEMLAFVHVASATTHAHFRSLVACGVYTLFLKEWLLGSETDTPLHALERAYRRAEAVYNEYGGDFRKEIQNDMNFLRPSRIIGLDRRDVSSGGFVLDSLNAAFWCLLTTDNYKDCVLKAVNLGSDTDTTAAVAGSLAAVVYGEDNIPESWKSRLLKKPLIASVSESVVNSVRNTNGNLKSLCKLLHAEWFYSEA